MTINETKQVQINQNTYYMLSFINVFVMSRYFNQPLLPSVVIWCLFYLNDLINNMLFSFRCSVVYRPVSQFFVLVLLWYILTVVYAVLTVAYMMTMVC